MRVGEFKDRRERRYVRMILIIHAAIVGVIVFGVQAYRHYAFPRAVATILDLREEPRRERGGPYTAIVGLIEFTREVDGGVTTCRTETDIGRLPDRYERGQKLAVIPATGTCNRVDIIGRL